MQIKDKSKQDFRVVKSIPTNVSQVVKLMTDPEKCVAG